MPENTEARKRRQKRSAVIGVAAFALLQAAVAVCFGALRQIPDLPGIGQELTDKSIAESPKETVK